MAQEITVVVSRSEGRLAERQALEDRVINHVESAGTLDLVVVSDLYGLRYESPDADALRRIPSNFILLSRLNSRAAHWTLDQLGVSGTNGTFEPRNQNDFTPSALDDVAPRSDQSIERVADRRPPNHRSIYHLDLRKVESPPQCIEELRMLLTKAAAGPRDAGGLLDDLPDDNVKDRAVPTDTTDPTSEQFNSHRKAQRRWYPVIDFSRCTNCLECIDFCLFGVYGLDDEETILVELPDNCRQGCPACSRVCPEQAVIFPLHKSPTIAGVHDASKSEKLDLSSIFEAVAPGDIAAAERARHLRGQEHSENQQSPNINPASEHSPETAKKDELDTLIDKLDELDSEQ